MVKSTLSASAAARYLGYKTANPIFDAIRSGELAAERGPAGRNGRTTTNYRIQRAELDKLAEARGIQPVVAEIVLAAEPEPPEEVPTSLQNHWNAVQDTATLTRERNGATEYMIPERVESNVARLLPLTGMVTVPLDFLNSWIERAIKAEVAAAQLGALLDGSRGHMTEAEHVENLYSEQHRFETELDRLRREVASMRTIVGKRVAREKSQDQN